MNQPKRLRRPLAGGYARGDETRLRIMAAAIELFGEYGFDGASTRDIAARAGVNAPALQYYFENKAGVLRACAEHIADDAWSAFEPVVAHAHELLSGNAEMPELIDAFCAFWKPLPTACSPNHHASPTTACFLRVSRPGTSPALPRRSSRGACANRLTKSARN